MALADLIALGGTQNKSPIQRFQETKAQNAQIERNRLADMATRLQLQAFPEQQRLANEARRESILTSQEARTAPPKGKRRNILIPGVEGVQAGIENTQGQIVSPTTGERIQGATIAPTRAETGEPGSLTGSQKGKQEIEFREKTEGVLNSVQGIDEVVKLVSSDQFIGGFTGDVVSAANSALQQLSQITGGASVIANGQLDESKLNLSKANLGRFRQAAINDDRVDSAVMELAFVFAKDLNPDGRISDADVRNAEKILSGSADKVSKVNTLRDVQKRVIRKFNNFAKIRKQKGTTLEEILGVQKPTGDPAQDAATQFLQEEGF